ncbi:MAG: outer membrane protein assembly factor BamD [Bryobacteraceae bacterium]
MLLSKFAIRLIALAAILAAFSSCARRKKYENPITKDTLQPDKVLFDKAIKDIERSRFEVARLTLNTLMNTYDTSEYLAKAKLAIADSWLQEGGTHGMAQAEAEYKDFILFYPAMEESAEAQEKVCIIHYKQMEKADRDPHHAHRAEDECRQLLTQFPNSKFAPQAQQRLREIQEVIADHEYRTGTFYHGKGSYPAAANRLQAVTDQFPLFSQADDALWQLGDSYGQMGTRYRDKSIAAYGRIVKDYPLSAMAEDAKKKLQSLEAPVPEADPVAYARMKYELENRQKASVASHVFGILRKSPDVRLAAKSGTPAMEGLRPTTPASVPTAAPTTTDVNADVTAGVVTDSKALDSNPDARQNPPKPEVAPEGGAATEAKPVVAPAADPLPTNHSPNQKKPKKEKKKKTVNNEPYSPR